MATSETESPLQSWLRLHENRLAEVKLNDLEEAFGIKSYRHPTLPLVGFKYNQIDSPKTHPVVRDARGTVLELDTWKMVARPFQRFFNAGEDQENFKKFDWSNFTATTKEDGSLIIVYYYAGEWHVNTSGTFGDGNVNYSRRNWRQLFWDEAQIFKPNLRKELTYLFELCTRYNQVIRHYPGDCVYMLSAFHTETQKELEPDEVTETAWCIRTLTPERHNFKSQDEIEGFLREKEATDKTFEGIVVRDVNGQRYKIKSQTYLALHHLFDNGNVANPKRLVPLIMAGEADEVLAYLPQLGPDIAELKPKIDNLYYDLVKLWRATKDIQNQKEFALAIVGKTPFSGILFNLRKTYGPLQTEGLLKSLWQTSTDAIIKHLFG